MSKNRNGNRMMKLLSLWLSIALLTAGMPAAVFASEPAVSGDGIENAVIPEEASSLEEAGALEEAVSDLPALSENDTPADPAKLMTIEVNQGLGRRTGQNDGIETVRYQFVADKQTAVTMMIPGSDAAGFTEEQAKSAAAGYKLEVKKVTNGQEADSAELTAEGFKVQRAYDINCDVAGWYAVADIKKGFGKGVYNFYIRSSNTGVGELKGVTFYETKKLNILVVPVKGYWSASYYPDPVRGGGAPAPGVYNVENLQFRDRDGNMKNWNQLCPLLEEYLLDLYPVAAVNIEEGPLLDAGNANFDMVVERPGQKNLWLEARNRQVKTKDGEDKYDLILAFVAYRQDNGTGQGYTYGRPANIITYTDSDMLPTVAHEIAHCYLIGDEYDGGSYNTRVNYPPNGYRGRDMITGKLIARVEGGNPYWQSPAQFKYDASNKGSKKDMIAENGAGTMIRSTLHPFCLSRQQFVRWGGVNADGSAAGSKVGPSITYMGSGYEGIDGYYWTSSALWDQQFKSLVVKNRKEDAREASSKAAGASEEEAITNAAVFAEAYDAGAEDDSESALNEDDFYYDKNRRFGESRMAEVNGWLIRNEAGGKPTVSMDQIFSYDGDLETASVLDAAYDESEDVYTFAALDSAGRVINSPVDGRPAACEFNAAFFSTCNLHKPDEEMHEVSFDIDAEYPKNTANLVIFKGRLSDISKSGTIDENNVIWKTSGDADYEKSLKDQPKGYLEYAEVNSERAVVQWDVYPSSNPQGGYKDSELFTEIFYWPEGDEGNVYYIGSSNDENCKEAIAGKSITFETDSNFDTKWTNNAYVQIKVTNGVNSVNIYSDDNAVTLSNSEIALAGAGIKKETDEAGRTVYWAEYTGKPITPSVTIKARDPETGIYSISLKKDVDYTVSYEDNIDAGYAEVIVQGIGACAGKNVQEFEIRKKTLTGTPESIPDMVYSGRLDEEVRPYLGMTDPNGNQLAYDEDFTVEYTTASGTKDKLSELIKEMPASRVTVTVTYKGKGNTNGECKTKVKFDVLPADGKTGALSNENTTVVLKKDSWQYTGKAVKPAVKSVTYRGDGKEVRLKSSEYKVVYSNNIEPGTMRVTIVGKKNYAGAAYTTAVIEPKTIKSFTVTGIRNQSYTGSRIDVNALPVVVKAGGITLVKDRDYTVSENSGCDYTGVTAKGAKKPEVIVKLIDRDDSKKASEQPRVVCVNESRKTVVKTFSIVKAKLQSTAVSFTPVSGTASENRVYSPADASKVIGYLRNRTKDESGKFTCVIEGEEETLVKNADVSKAAGLWINGTRIDPSEYDISVSKTKDGKTGSITYKAKSSSASFSGKKTVKFMYKKKPAPVPD